MGCMHKHSCQRCQLIALVHKTRRKNYITLTHWQQCTSLTFLQKMQICLEHLLNFFANPLQLYICSLWGPHVSKDIRHTTAYTSRMQDIVGQAYAHTTHTCMQTCIHTHRQTCTYCFCHRFLCRLILSIKLHPVRVLMSRPLKHNYAHVWHKAHDAQTCKLMG